MIAQWSDRKWSGREGGTGSGKIRKLGFELGIGTNFLVLFLYYYSIWNSFIFVCSVKFECKL